MFEFQILKKSKKSKARLGLLSAPHGEIKTPAFITVGTKGTVKSLTPDDLDAIGTQMVFVNTYHTVLSPGVDIVEIAGGIHQFSGIKKPIITDSGGFQVFSLARTQSHTEGVRMHETHPRCVRITDDGVEFRSPIDGAKYFFTSEFSIDAQRRIGADLIVAFDECIPYNVSFSYVSEAVERTYQWAKRSLKEFSRYDVGKQKLYGVIQGGCFEDLRKESARAISALPFFGLAIGGVSVGETKKEMRDQMRSVMDELGDDPRPRHLLGVGEFYDIVDAAAMGIDTMDCVIPTRHARMGKLYQYQISTPIKESLSGSNIKNQNDRLNIKNINEIDIAKASYKQDFDPIDEDCECYACQHFTKAYLHHLFKQRELLAYRLATIHNLHFMEKFFEQIRKAIENDIF